MILMVWIVKVRQQRLLVAQCSSQKLRCKFQSFFWNHQQLPWRSKAPRFASVKPSSRVRTSNYYFMKLLGVLVIYDIILYRSLSRVAMYTVCMHANGRNVRVIHCAATERKASQKSSSERKRDPLYRNPMDFRRAGNGTVKRSYTVGSALRAIGRR